MFGMLESLVKAATAVVTVPVAIVADARCYRAIRSGRIYIEHDQDTGTIYAAGRTSSEYCKTPEELDAYIDRELDEGEFEE